MPRSLVVPAIDYELQQWSEIELYLTDGSFQIDNNSIERQIRPIAVGATTGCSPARMMAHGARQCCIRSPILANSTRLIRSITCTTSSRASATIGSAMSPSSCPIAGRQRRSSELRTAVRRSRQPLQHRFVMGAGGRVQRNSDKRQKLMDESLERRQTTAVLRRRRKKMG